MLEENFRRAMLLSRGSFNVFVNRPISATLLGVIAVLAVWQSAVFIRKLIKSPDHHIHSDNQGAKAPAPVAATATAGSLASGE
jgi:TctA family transporter